MSEEMQKAAPRKTISARRDELQSASLVTVVVPLLAASAAYLEIHAAAHGASVVSRVVPLLLSLGFASLVLLLRAATLPAAGIGFLVCLILSHSLPTLSCTALPALVMLFLLTFAATRFGRSKKEARHLAERRSGRRASQIIANLGVAALFGIFVLGWGWYYGCIAALAEAAADTVSSEIGQAIGGPAWLITTLRRVPAGTDGGISAAGSTAGIVASAMVVTAGMANPALWRDAPLVFAASCAGLFFDSILGATVERRGWLGNDLVNFCSTLFAAGLAVGLFFLRGKIA